ncbi:RNA-guided endonuclease InsQ/TnpB family protein [Candidatus Methylacidiphilum infernorum]|uniref:RNA-guided endonuclease InsQ/TnpB family protein n=1 Tax=Candidatus Methylacidiphilum infernorum TaxID=511746 RepID=UPI001F5E2CB5|nr:transposase [Candidatus Methylacidiphilum infernorum]
MSATISQVAYRWFVSITVDVAMIQLPKAENQGSVGVDLGVSALATLSTVEKVPGPKPLKALLGRLRRLSRRISRKAKGSANLRKAKVKLVRLHDRISNVRLDALHKLTTCITCRFSIFGIEDLNVCGMMGNRCLDLLIGDVGIYELRRQLEYKATMSADSVVVADRFYANSKRCSACGSVFESLPLSTRGWKCPACGEVHDRVLNAAKNLEYLEITTASSAGNYACGETGSGLAFCAKRNCLDEAGSQLCRWLSSSE